MYTNYSNYQDFPSYHMYPGTSEMKQTAYPATYQTVYDTSSGDDRFLGGGLLAAGLVGGLAGAAVSPYFYRPYPYYPYAPYQPCCPPFQPYGFY